MATGSAVKEYKIADLIERTDPDGKTFRNSLKIPNYQRGYRWTEREVKKLLDDINEARENGKSKYCLQPVVAQFDGEKEDVVKAGYSERTITKQTWHIIDGQQRLTTLFLILHCFKGGAVYDITYESRDKNDARIKEWINEIKRWNPDEDLLPLMGFDPQQDTLDIRYMSQAIKTIRDWVGDKIKDGNNLTSKMADFIRENVYILWYEFGEQDGDPIALFSRINMGKIPLTISELLKAMILRLNSKQIQEESRKLCDDMDIELQSKEGNLIKREIEAKFSEAQIQNAAAWDRMEQQLANDDFFRFICSDSNTEINNRMDYYFQICYLYQQLETNPGTRNLIIPNHETLFDFFEEQVLNDQVDTIWNALKELHKTLWDWYSAADTEAFHKVGFLVAARKRGISCAEVICRLYFGYRGEESKKTFKNKFLDGEIQEVVAAVFREDGISTLDEITYSSKDGRHSSTKSAKMILLLFNVLSAIVSPNFRFSFEKVYPLERGATLEHIFPQHPGLDDVTKNNDSLRDFIRETQEEAKKASGVTLWEPDLTGSQEEKIANINAWWQAACVALKLYEKQDDNQRDAIQRLGNLALISHSMNASLTNNMFSAKQASIKSFDKEGEYIPLCTHNAFLKYYSIKDKAEAEDSSTSLAIWTLQDIENHEAAIKEKVSKYLPPKETNNESTDGE